MIAGEAYPLADKVAEAREIADDLRFGPSTQALVDAAVKRGIPWTRLSEDSLVEFGYGIHRRRIQATTSSQTDHIAVDIAQDKNLTKVLLERALLPVPGGKSSPMSTLRSKPSSRWVDPLRLSRSMGITVGVSVSIFGRKLVFVKRSRLPGNIRVK